MSNTATFFTATQMAEYVAELVRQGIVYKARVVVSYRGMAEETRYEVETTGGY